MGFFSVASKLVRGASHTLLQGARQSPGTMALLGPAGVGLLGAAKVSSWLGGGNTGVSGGMGYPALPTAPPPGGSPVFQTQGAARSSYVMPNLDASMIAQLEAAGLMIGFSALRTFHRSPSKKHVIVHPTPTQTFALEKGLARKWGLWKPSAKPPISAGDWHAITRANHVIKKLKHMGSEVRKVANFGSRSIHPSYRVVETAGKKMIARKS